ncbi:FAD-dependent monooxygenase, partial [Pseudomonadota bacterium]|nr:FAD-dependent monooxygenase [Pseudomonadota bacterium]
MQNFDIAIVGFGPVGAAAANMFAESGFNIIVLEPKHEIWDIPRAVHFDGQTQRIFQSMGIFDQIQEIIDPILGVNFINRNGKELLSVGFENHPKLNGYYDGVMFNQPKFEEILRKNASKYNNIELKLGWQVEKLDSKIDTNILEITNKATNQTESLTSTYVLAADGADSFVRRSLNIKMHDYKCDQDWVVVDYLIDRKYKVLDKSRYQI